MARLVGTMKANFIAFQKKSTTRTFSQSSHALRHFFASTALHEGETIKAVSEYLGHADPGFTLRTYTHLMEGSSARTKRAIDTALLGAPEPKTPTKQAARQRGPRTRATADGVARPRAAEPPPLGL